MADSFRHLFLQNSGTATRYIRPGGGGPDKSYPKRNRREHSTRLRVQLDAAWKEEKTTEEARTAVGLPVRDGTYLEFESQTGHDLALLSRFENRPKGIRLANVRQDPPTENGVKGKTYATVYVPAGKENHFLNKIEEYIDDRKNTKEGNYKNQDLVTSIEDIRLAVVRSFWQDDPTLIPDETACWCEIWLRSSENKDVVASFWEVAAVSQIEVQEDVLTFPERLVVLAFVNASQLGELVAASDDIAEFRRARETARFFLELNNQEQTAWVEELHGRLSVLENPSVAVTILDSGVNNGHVLLQSVLADSDRQAVKRSWGTTDHNGHGTNVAGIVAYGDLQQALESNAPVTITHCLESVKILPPSGNNPAQLYGYYTIQAVNLAEIQAPERTHIPCMAVTTGENYGRGRPSAWSAAIDQLTSGVDNGLKYLFVVAAGNLADPNEWPNYPDSNLTTPVHDPAQAWNALVVGAYTQKFRLTDPRLSGYAPVANVDGLSPFSSTSLTWDTNKWPVKPDVVMEGGNAALSSNNGFAADCDDLALLTTGYQPLRREIELFNMTSAATAKAGWLAAQIQAMYPTAWPETVRGLIVHSAEWTKEMETQFIPNGSKTEYANLLRICGYGVPNLDRAINCYQNSLTLVMEETLQPFEKAPNGKYRMKDMHFHRLPWPSEVLMGLEEIPVTLRVTLSYFIEPSPAEIGWQDRYRYPSHGLRFAINNPNETFEEFRARRNKADRNDSQNVSTSSGAERWVIGSTGRDKGSLHSDVWYGTGAELATCNFIGIYPIGGWWKDRAWLGRSEREVRYSLIVSITTPSEEVDIYTPIATIVNTPVTVEIESGV